MRCDSIVFRKHYYEMYILLSLTMFSNKERRQHFLQPSIASHYLLSVKLQTLVDSQITIDTVITSYSNTFNNQFDLGE